MAKQEDYILTSFYLTAYSNGNMSTVCSHTVDGVSKVQQEKTKVLKVIYQAIILPTP